MHSPIGQPKASNRPQTRGCGSINQFQRRIDKRKNGKKNTHLTEIIKMLIAEYHEVRSRDLEQQENSYSYSVNQAQDHHPVFSVQDAQGMDSNRGGTPDELDGLQLDDLLDDLPSNELDTSEPVVQPNRTLAEFLMKIDEDVQSNVDISDFMSFLEGEHKTIGRYSFPLSLVPTVERIISVYGDVSAPSLINSNVAGQIYILFCATVKEMEHLHLDQVSPEKMLKWRDAIKDALRINFNVEFAMNHLKKIARAYFGLAGRQVLQSIDDKLDALYNERAQTYERFQDCLADAEDFSGKSVSTGLFP
ncbi:Fiber Fb17-like protein [Theobroma cacao]|uniref:Fiber Fb17-like protein n=1 Tax=Theobroma cacao TaxID=3641 RepID=A0A061F8L1_THECC|nr:Fiber Fb17-like protein [Theobroma cacao]